MRKSLVSGLEQPATSLAHYENLHRQMRSRIAYRVRVEKITLVCYSVFHSSNLRLFGISQLVSHIYTFSQCFHFVCCCSGLTAWRSHYCRCRSLRRVHIFIYIATSAVAARQQQQPPSRSHTNVRSHTLYNMRGAW